MTDEKTQAAIERLTALRSELTKVAHAIGVDRAYEDIGAITLALAALAAANERAERECVWTWDEHHRIWNKGCGWITAALTRFCDTCGGKVRAERECVWTWDGPSEATTSCGKLVGAKALLPFCYMCGGKVKDAK